MPGKYLDRQVTTILIQLLATCVLRNIILLRILSGGLFFSGSCNTDT